MEGPVYGVEEVAKLTGVAVRTLQRWDEDGLATASDKTGGGGHRRYTQRDLKRVYVIVVLRGAKLRGAALRRALDSLEWVERRLHAQAHTPVHRG